MIRKLLVVLTVVFAWSATSLFGQTGAIKVKLTDNKEPIPFASVVVEQNGAQVGFAQTDDNGECTIKPLNPGKYTVKAVNMGQTMEIKEVTVTQNNITHLPIVMAIEAIKLGIVEVKIYIDPLIPEGTETGQTVTRDEYQNMPSKDINTVAATTAGVFQRDAGGAVNMKGARSEGTDVYIDGMKFPGGSVPAPMVEQVTVTTGGLPAQYGDATGGIISITTRGPQSKPFGNIEAITSQFIDASGAHSLSVLLGGPLLFKKDSVDKSKKAVLGYIVNASGGYSKSGASAVGWWKVKDDVLSELEQNPLRPSVIGKGFVKNAEFITKDDLEQVKAYENGASKSLALTGKVDYKPTENMNITLNGSMNYANSRNFSFGNMLFNSKNNPQSINLSWNTYAKLTQKLNSQTKEEEGKSASTIKNAFYTIQVGYSQTQGKSQDYTHKDNFFDYGYIGKFNQYKAPDYELRSGSKGMAFYQTKDKDSILTFEASDKNPLAAVYTQRYYDFVSADSVINGDQITQGLGLLNGKSPSSVYSLWSNTGTSPGSYGISNMEKFNVLANFSADIKNHNIQFGLEYDQTTSRSYSVSELWTLMRQLTNSHIADIDTNNPVFVKGTGTYDYYNNNQRYDAASQRQFDKSLRAALGMPIEGTDWIDIDSYEPSTFKIDMFSADDVLNNGSGVVSYVGYDYKGNRLKSNPSFEDFFTKKDDKGNFTREIGAFSPIYIAGYIQDKFDFKDLTFNVGLRVDRYDANQKVLKDKFLLYEAKTAGEVNSFGIHPANIGNDYVVYVDDIKDPSHIVGYRHEATWYNAAGTEIQDPELLAKATTTGKIAPYLVDPNSKEVKSSAFTDYKPQINLNPRIAFAFPISDVAGFYAHYDILTQRPSGANRLDPLSYLFIQSLGGGTQLSNPDLKPEKTIDYELGYRQTLNEKKNSALELSAFYREQRDMIQAINVSQAYPTSYITWGNIDFGTTKGFSIAYDLRRTAGVQLNVNYTLQFAEGTGSSASSGVSLINSGQPNLRTPMPLSWDQRHKIATSLDYRFGSGGDYKGPVWTKKKGKEGEKSIRVFGGMGANMVLNAGSGTPYSKQANITQNAGGVAQRSVLKGSINGAELPWTYRIDLKIDKNIDLTWGGKKEGEDKKTASLIIYLQVLNVLNTQNIMNVYRATGNPDDDGYLSAPEAQKSIASQTDQTSFIDLYSLRVNAPGNYSIPRRIRLGLNMSF